MDVAGVRSTHGSPIFADHVPTRSDLQVEALEASGGDRAGASSNAPEFAAGANTFNEVFGKTRNPWNTAMSCGGSSGGAAVALATGEAWLANGSDLGGSLRIPAGFCSVVGLRPSAGRGAARPGSDRLRWPCDRGPMARNVADLALMLDAMAASIRAIRCRSTPPPDGLSRRGARRPGAARIGFSPDLGFLPSRSRARATSRPRRRGALPQPGVVVEEASPDFAGAAEIFQTLRGHALCRRATRRSSPSIARVSSPNRSSGISSAGLKLDGAAMERRAERERTALYTGWRRFFTGVGPPGFAGGDPAAFPASRPIRAGSAGQASTSYIDWLVLTFA